MESPSFASKRLKWLTRFWRGREPEHGPLTLGRKRIYILPTREGIAFFFVVSALVLGSLNYQTSLGFVLAFMVAGIGLSGMIHSHRNLSGLTLTVLEPTPVFAGRKTSFPVRIDNPSGQTRYSLIMRNKAGYRIVVDAPRGTSETWIEVEMARRGVKPLGLFTIETFFPLNLFRAWSPVVSGTEVLVYPSPGAQRPFPDRTEAADSQGEGARGLTGTGADEFSGVKPYAPGEPVRRIHWKASARTETLLLKQFDREAQGYLVFDFDSLSNMNVETKLRTLCRWILDGDRAQAAYSLKLPGRTIGPGSGPAHRAMCLEALARFEK